MSRTKDDKTNNYYYADSDTTDPNFTDLTPIGEGIYKNKFGKIVYDTTKVTPPKKDKSINDNWQTAYAKGVPSGTMSADMETMNAVTGGVLNWTMPSQVVGASARLMNDGDFGQFGRNLILGNNGIVSDKFAQEHPWYSLAANGAFDVASLGLAHTGTSGVKKLVNHVGQGIKNNVDYAKYIVKTNPYYYDLKHPISTAKAIRDGRYTPLFRNMSDAKKAFTRNSNKLQQTFDDAFNFVDEFEGNKNNAYRLSHFIDMGFAEKPKLVIEPTKSNLGSRNIFAEMAHNGRTHTVRMRHRSSPHILYDPNSSSTKGTFVHEIEHEAQAANPHYIPTYKYDGNIGYHRVNPNSDEAKFVFEPIMKNSDMNNNFRIWQGSPREVQSEYANFASQLNNPSPYKKQPWINRLILSNKIAKRFNINRKEADQMLINMSKFNYRKGGLLKKIK